MIYQHEARGADRRITDAIDVHVQAQHGKTDGDDGPAAALVPAGNGPLMAQRAAERLCTSKAQVPGLAS
jgi:hypothetical protein